MVGQPGLFDIDERLKDLSAKGDDIERLNVIVDFELFRPDLEYVVPKIRLERIGDRGGRGLYFGGSSPWRWRYAQFSDRRTAGGQWRKQTSLVDEDPNSSRVPRV
jgi:hypothetical protein